MTKLCGCDKQLQSLCVELSQLQVEKDNLQAALEVSHIQWQESKYTEAQMSQKALLQEELVTIRARICDVLTDMDCVWCQYERMESELAVFRSQLQHVCYYGMHQEQHKAQKQLWMMEDILCGLRSSRNHYRLVLGLQDEPGEEMSGQNLTARCDSHNCSKPFSSSQEQKQHDWNQDNRVNTWLSADPALNITGFSNTCSRDSRKGRQDPDYTKGVKSCGGMADVPKEVSSSKLLAFEDEGSSESQKATALPLRVTRVVTATLPSALTAHRVSVQDPPPELLSALPEQISQTLPKRTSRVSSQNTAPKSEIAIPRSVQLARQRNEIIGSKASQQNRQYSTSKENMFDQELDSNIASNRLGEERREQREAKLKRVERIRQRVIRSASRDNYIQTGHLPLTDPMVKKTVLPESEVLVFDSTSSNTCSGDPEETEKLLESRHGYTKGRKHKIHNNFLAHVSFPVQDTALTTKAVSTEKPSSSTNNRSEWFLSACEWQGFRPVVTPGLESFCHDATVAELQTLPHYSHKTQQNSDNKKLSRNEIYILAGKPRYKENSESLLSETFVSQDEKGETSETVCDILHPSESVLIATAANCSSEDRKNGTPTKNESKQLPNYPVAPSASKDKCIACLPQQLGLELSLYEEIPYVLSSQREKSKNDTDNTLTTEHSEHEMEEPNPKYVDEVGEDVTLEKNGLSQSETVLCVPENSQSHIHSENNQSVYSAKFTDGVGNHSPSFVWKRVTMDSTCL